MSSAVAELESGLQTMLTLKPPGVSGSRINTLTALCVANIQSESVLIQKLYTHFKKAPGTHKLGVLYVIDSVVRQWSSHAKSNGQVINSSAADGTYAAGVNKITELLPALMADISQFVPTEQKEKVKKLIEIWEKVQTFPLTMLNKFKEKLSEVPPSKVPANRFDQNHASTASTGASLVKSTTPDGTPPRSLAELFDSQGSINMNSTYGPPASISPSTKVTDTSAILAALANMARPSPAIVTSAEAAPPAAAVQVSGNHYSNAMDLNGAFHNAAVNSLPPTLSNTQPINGLANGYNPNPVQPTLHNQGNQQNQYSSHVTPYQYSAPPPPAAAAAPIAADNTVLQQQLLVLKTLAEQGVPQDQWATILAVLAGTTSNAPPPGTQQDNSSSWSGNQPDNDRDRNLYQQDPRDDSSRYRRRSISPQAGWREQGYDDYDRGSPRDGRGNEYRQRSPQGRRGRSPTPPYRRGGSAEKYVDYDPTVKAGHVKVLSRTLFVGGVTQSEQELRSIFQDFGQVQSCIVNREKRHAFVKMTSRADAVAAKDGMERQKTYGEKARTSTTRWGVGFGPRDCCDYNSGISVIPIASLTDADRKWMLTAEHGGTGGKSIESGIVVEEPDIEIGAGVSSKAISRRVETDKASQNGQRFGQTERRGDRNNGDDRRGGGRKWNNNGRRQDHNKGGAEQEISVGMPADFLAQFPYPVGMPNMPAGFFPPGSMPPPPPGRN